MTAGKHHVHLISPPKDSRKENRMKRNGFAMAAAMLVIAASRVWAAPAGAQTGVIDAINVREGQDGASHIEITTSTRPTFTTWKLSKPSRVVVEVSGTVPGSVDSPFEADTFVV